MLGEHSVLSCPIGFGLGWEAGTWEVTSGPGDLESLHGGLYPMLSLGVGPPTSCLAPEHGNSLEGLPCLGKAGNGACTSQEEHFYVDKKDIHFVQTWPA